MTRAVRKIAGDAPLAGDSPGYWDHQWEATDIGARVQAAEARPTAMELLISEDVTAGPVLEAGCGSGWVVEWQTRRGFFVVGIDFAEATLRKARAQVPSMPLVIGDLERLPFREGAFRSVISLGALEHIEHGPDVAMAEHHRVLHPDGTFVATLPRVSWIKALNDGWHIRLRRQSRYRSARGRWVELAETFERGTSASSSFIQYEMASRRWVDLLRRSGLEVSKQREVLVGAGLGELGVLRTRARSTAAPASEGAGETRVPELGAHVGVLRRLWNAGVSQQPEGTLEQATAWTMRHLAGHMILLVARKGVRSQVGGVHR